MAFLDFKTLALTLLAVNSAVAEYTSATTNSTSSAPGLDTSSFFGGNKKCANFQKVFGRPSSEIQKLIFDSSLRSSTAEKLGNAVKIPTVVNDNYPNPANNATFPGWLVFKDLHAQLAKDFPLCWKNMKVESINEYSLLLTWQGSDTSKQPVLFNAHQDVVPVDETTESEWTHPPFSGYFDGEYVWGRGSTDDKSNLIGMLQAAEYIMETQPDFKPSRTVLFTFGCDEEISGKFGAKYIAEVVEQRYGKYGIHSITDEGNPLINIANKYVAAPATAEKGLYIFDVQLDGPGGHSSVPPRHTLIGFAAQMISEIEGTQFKTYFTKKNPMTQLIGCVLSNLNILPNSVLQQYSDSFYNPIANNPGYQYILNIVGTVLNSFFRTSQAVTIIQGGVKANALPEQTTFTVSARISIDSSIAETAKKFIDQITSVSNKFSLTLYVDDELVLDNRNNTDVVVHYSTRTQLEPSPISPENDVWNEYAGVIKGFWEDIVFPKVIDTNSTSNSTTECLVSGSLLSGNTDSKHYWNLTQNIYRYSPDFLDREIVATIHSLNEHVSLDTVMYTVGFFYDYIFAVQNSD